MTPMLSIFRMGIHAVTVSPGIYDTFMGIQLQTSDWLPLFYDSYWVIFYTLSSGGVWLAFLLVVILGLLPYLAVEPIRSLFPQMLDDCKGRKVYKVEDINKDIVYYVNQAFERE